MLYFPRWASNKHVTRCDIYSTRLDTCHCGLSEERHWAGLWVHWLNPLPATLLSVLCDDMTGQWFWDRMLKLLQKWGKKIKESVPEHDLLRVRTAGFLVIPASPRFSCHPSSVGQFCIDSPDEPSEPKPPYPFGVWRECRHLQWPFAVSLACCLKCSHSNTPVNQG